MAGSTLTAAVYFYKTRAFIWDPAFNRSFTVCRPAYALYTPIVLSRYYRGKANDRLTIAI